jgi:hypothetical protein
MGAAVRRSNGGVARYVQRGGAKAPPFNLQKVANSTIFSTL